MFYKQQKLQVRQRRMLLRVSHAASCFALAILLVSVASNSAHAGCARERANVNKVDLQKITGYSKDQLVLMPACYWVYSDGMLVTRYVAASEPCHGPECSQRHQQSSMPLAPSTDFSIRSVDLIGPSASNWVFHPKFEGQVFSIDVSWPSFSQSPIERPPIAA